MVLVLSFDFKVYTLQRGFSESGSDGHGAGCSAVAAPAAGRGGCGAAVPGRCARDAGAGKLGIESASFGSCGGILTQGHQLGVQVGVAPFCYEFASLRTTVACELRELRRGLGSADSHHVSPGAQVFNDEGFEESVFFIL